MTAQEKTDIAEFLDLAAITMGSAYHSGKREYNFTDDDSPEQIRSDIESCSNCALCTTRAHAVPGEGQKRPLLMIIGEVPDNDEDSSGKPFAGESGQLLDKMLLSINLSRERDCFLTNIIKCRTPIQRDPQADEITACSSYIERQIRLMQPCFILCAGRIAAQTLLKTNAPIGNLRNRFIDYKIDDISIPSIVTYHPNALLRNEELKRPAWEDLKLLRTAMEKNQDIVT